MCYQPKNCKEFKFSEEERRNSPTLRGVEDLKNELKNWFKDFERLPNDLWEYREFIINKNDILWEEKYNSLVDKFKVQEIFKI